jgi:hypothetical protein
MHPLRVQRWALSDLNPWLWPLPALASSVKSDRHTVPPENPYRQLEKATSDLITASLNLYRDLRDATLEAWFFQIYGTAAVLRAAAESGRQARPKGTDSRELPQIRDALATIGHGGYPEAVALIGALLGRAGGETTLGRLALVERFIRGDEVLARLPAEEIRRIRAQQAVIAELEPERGLESLPQLLTDSADRQRVLDVLEEAVAAVQPTRKQQAVVDRVREILRDRLTPPVERIDRQPETEVVRWCSGTT